MKVGPIVIMSQKELLDLLIMEKRASYRKGYKAGAQMRYRHTLPEKYGDSLPLVPIKPEANMHFDYAPNGNLRVSGIDVVVENPTVTEPSDTLTAEP